MHLVPELLVQRNLLREQVCGYQSLEEIVGAAIAIATCEPEHPCGRICLEHGANDARRPPFPYLHIP
jgi:hypothetical protein